MMGSTLAAEKIAPFYDQDKKGKTLREFIRDVWIKKDNYGWSDEHFARQLNEVCHGRAGAARNMTGWWLHLPLLSGCRDPPHVGKS